MMLKLISPVENKTQDKKSPSIKEEEFPSLSLNEDDLKDSSIKSIITVNNNNEIKTEGKSIKEIEDDEDDDELLEERDNLFSDSEDEEEDNNTNNDLFNMSERKMIMKMMK